MKNPLVRVGAGMVLSFGLLTSSGCGGSGQTYYFDVVPKQQQPQVVEPEGVKIVTTSNRPPRDLYKDGLNRELFIPFIELIETRMIVTEVNGPTDYRLDRLEGVEVWHVPNGPKSADSTS